MTRKTRFGDDDKGAKSSIAVLAERVGWQASMGQQRHHTNIYPVDTPSGRTLATFDIGKTPQGVAIGPRERWDLAVSAGTSTVAAIDLKTGKQGPHDDTLSLNVVRQIPTRGTLPFRVGAPGSD